MMKEAQTISIRPARLDDREALRAMQMLAMCVLGAQFYPPAAIGGFVVHVGTMDDFLLNEGTYYVAERDGEIVASGGWSRRRPNYANATGPAGLHADLVVPKVRSVFVHPDFARRGLASRLMDRAESEVAAAGFEAVELTATLSGVPLYASRGYRETGGIAIPLPGGHAFGAMTMRKPLTDDHATRTPRQAAG